MNDALSCAVAEFLKDRRGVCETTESVAEFRTRLGAQVPEWYTDMMLRWPLGGASINFLQGGIEASIDWLTLKQTTEEAYDFMPGSAVRVHGYIPVAGCATGSGDPYFIYFTGTPNEQIAALSGDLTDPPLLQIYHDAVDDSGELGSNAYSLIAQSCSLFFRYARLA